MLFKYTKYFLQKTYNNNLGDKVVGPQVGKVLGFLDGVKLKLKFFKLLLSFVSILKE